MADDHREGDNSTAAVINPSHREIKRARDSIDGEDLISSMPDEIIHHIFSFIPTNFAIRTSVLSKRWRHVWSETPSLSIDFCRSDPNSINETLTRYLAPKITSFDLCISKAHQIDNLIEFALSRNTENLSLEFRDSYDRYYDLPDFFYTSSSLKQLLVESGTINTIPRGTTVSWTSLKTLTLSFCVLSDESLAKILSGSPLLESLTLHDCAKLNRLDLSKSLQVKRLDIEDCGSMQIVAPHIHCLRLVHSELRCGLVDVSSLTEAYLNIYCSKRLLYLYNDFSPETRLADSLQAMIVKTLEKLQNVKKFTVLGAFFLQNLSLAEVCGVPFPTLKVEALTFETIIDRSIIPGVAKLLQNSPRLKKLKLHIVDCKVIQESYLNNHLYWKGVDTYQWWKPKDLVFPTLSEQKLKSSFMNFLLENTGDDCYAVGSYTFSQNNNSELSVMIDSTH